MIKENVSIIIGVDANSPYFDAIKRLWRSHSDTLGFFPEGAFQSHAIRKTILVAVDSSERCVGYLLYRISRNKVSIVHLCVDDAHQRQGIAQKLVSTLSRITQFSIGIEVTCRRDFEANAIWPRFGFIAQSERPGRNIEGKILTSWWLDHNHPNIFSFSHEEHFRTMLVLDANVFYDIVGEDLTPKSEESKSLTADWLQESVELCLTPEIKNEINRNPDAAERKKLLAQVSKFSILPQNQAAYSEALQSLSLVMRKPEILSDRSDLQQLAWAVGNGQQFFVTRDQNLLDQREILYKFGLTPIRPSDAIVYFDQLRRQATYNPVQLASTQLLIRKLRAGEQEEVAPLFQNSDVGETRNQILALVRRYLAQVERYEVLTVSSSEQGPLALIVYDRENPGTLDIPLFRVKRLQSNISAAPTLAKHLLLRFRDVSVQEGRTSTVCSDRSLQEFIQRALEEDGFSRLDQKWHKLNLRFLGTTEELAHRLRGIKPDDSELPRRLLSLQKPVDKHIASELERNLWPAKLVDVDLPTYIVPIRPHWAQELFDDKLAKQSLFGASEKLILNRELVYYRSRRPGNIFAPRRILWYVSDERGYENVKSLRACSVLNEVVVDQPKSLFRQFRRLGVYQWENVFEVAKGNVGEAIMALRFSMTETFRNPIPWNELQRILEEHDLGSPLASPRQINNPAFERLYAMGTGIQPAS